MKNRKQKIAIVGAGIGGLTAAAALTQRGFETHVYERTSQLLEVGAGLQMGPNAVKVVDALGLGAPFREMTAEPVDRISLDWATGQERYRERFMGNMQQDFGAPYLMAHRADLHALLRSQVPESRIHLDAQCVGVSTTDGSATVALANGQEIEADVVVGADGIHSAVRSAFLGTEKPRFTNQICWRLVLPMEALHKVASQLPIKLDGTENTGWIGPTGHVLFYPLRQGKMLNIFAGRVSEQWVGESWTVPSSLPDMLKAYDGWHEGMLAVMAQAESAHVWGIHDRDPLQKWTFGRVTLLGDAAHPMMPTLAQGAAMSMEDGYALARCIDVSSQDIDLALASYDRERRPRTTKVQLQARQQFLNNQLNPAPQPLATDWIYGYDAVRGGEHAAV